MPCQELIHQASSESVKGSCCSPSSSAWMWNRQNTMVPIAMHRECPTSLAPSQYTKSKLSYGVSGPMDPGHGAAYGYSRVYPGQMMVMPRLAIPPNGFPALEMRGPMRVDGSSPSYSNPNTSSGVNGHPQIRPPKFSPVEKKRALAVLTPIECNPSKKLRPLAFVIDPKTKIVVTRLEECSGASKKRWRRAIWAVRASLKFNKLVEYERARALVSFFASVHSDYEAGSPTGKKGRKRKNKEKTSLAKSPLKTA